MHKSLFLLILVVMVAVSPAYPQDHFNLEELSAVHGLPHNHVVSLAPDSTGFLWIATWDGLSRYDGYDFVNYYHDPEDSTSIPYFNVEKVLVDKYNNVWVNTLGHHPVILNRATDTFYPVGTISPDFVQQIIEVSPGGDVWQWHAIESLGKFDYDADTFRRMELVDINGHLISPERLRVDQLAFDNLQNPWLIPAPDGDSLILYAGEMSDANRIRLRPFAISISSYYRDGTISHRPLIRPFVRKDGSVALYSNASIFIINSEKAVSKISSGELNPVKENRDDLTYWSDENSCFVSYPGDFNLLTITLNDGKHTEAMLCSKDGTLWISRVSPNGEGTGVVKAIPVTGFFRHHFLDLNEKGVQNAFFAILKDANGEIWGAPRNLRQIFRSDASGNITSVARHAEKHPQHLFHPRSFLTDSSGIWIGYYRNKLVHYSYETGQISPKFVSDAADALSPEHGFRNLIRVGKLLIFHGDSYLKSYHTVTGEIRQIYAINGNSPVYSLRADGKGGFWAGTARSRLLHFNREFQPDLTVSVTKGMYNVEDICQGDDNDLWLALLGGGLCHYHPETGKSEIHTTAQGLSNNTCYSILKDKSGHLWISTNHGISRFNPLTGKFRIFGPSDGLKIDEFNSDAAYLAPDGEMFFGGMGGAVSFYPDLIEQLDSKAPPATLIITELRSSGELRRFEKAIYECKNVVLEKGADNFRVSFACLDFQNPDKIRYRYRLTGEADWTETDHLHRNVNYANLTPGNYRLDIEATNRNGDWASVTALDIRIPPHFYQAGWFRFTVAMAILSLLGYIVYDYNRQIRLKAVQQQQELKLESLRGQMNPHFIFNSLNSINYFISQNDRLSANRYIADFSRLIRSILSNMSKEFVPFETELGSIQDYLKLEHLRFGDKFEYTLTLPETLNITEWWVFPGLMQPFVENAIWHGVRGLENRKGKIDISFRMTDERMLTCIVEDDGIGRKLSSSYDNDDIKRKSRGIAIVNERLSIINNLRNTNYAVTIEDLNPDRRETGTKVTIRIPLKNSP